MRLTNTDPLWLLCAGTLHLKRSLDPVCPTAASSKLVMKCHVIQFPPKMGQNHCQSSASVVNPEEVCWCKGEGGKVFGTETHLSLLGYVL